MTDHERYPRFKCKFRPCQKRFERVSERNEHMEKKHGVKRKPKRAGDYGSHDTPVLAILREIARRQKAVYEGGKLVEITGPLASHLAPHFNITQRAMRKRMASLEEQGLVTYERWNGCIVTVAGFDYITQHKKKGNPK